MDYGTSLGLAMSSGINAYLPLLSFAIATRWLHLYKLNPDFSYITQDWFMITLAILALADLFADKIPGVDHVWDAIHTVLRPLAGAVVAAASGAPPSGPVLPVMLVAGGTLAGMTHAVKSVTRVASTGTTAGFMNTIISILEDIAVVIGVALSLFAPVIMVVLVVAFVLAFIIFVPRLVRAFKRWRQRSRPQPVPQHMQTTTKV